MLHIARRQYERGGEKMGKENYFSDKIAAKAAYLVARKNVNATCFFLFHQPKVPDGLKKLKDNKC